MVEKKKPPWEHANSSDSIRLGQSRLARKIVASHQPARARGWDQSRRAEYEHNRFAHANSEAIDAMYRNKTATGLYYASPPGKNRVDCESCRLVKAKLSTNPVGDKLDKATKPFEHVALDVITLKPTSRSGNNVVFYYVDQFTKTVVPDPRKSKAHAKESLKHFLTKHVTSKGFEIKRLQADSEAIFAKSKSYRKLLRDRGISPTYSSAYCHYQNSLAERSWGTHKSAAATVMKAGGISSRYWDYIIPAVAKTLDILPLKSMSYTKSPYELRTGHRPDVRGFVPLGNKAYVRLYPDETRWRSNTDTLRPKSEMGVVIGYPEDEKGSYYVLMPGDRVVARRDVVVDHVSNNEGLNNDRGMQRTSTKNAASHRPKSTPLSERARSSRIAGGVSPHPRYATDQRTDPSMGNRGRVENVAAHSAQPRTPGRIPLPKIVNEAPRSLAKAFELSDPIYVKAWQEAAELEMKAFESHIIPCSAEETRGHKIYRMFDILKYKKDRELQELIFKLRLVFDGSQQKKGVDYDESFSPTLSMRSLFIMIHIATCRGMKSWQADIGNAYLQAIDRQDLFVSLPRVFGRRYKYAKLVNCNVYGKTTAGRLWYFTFNQLLIETGWTRSIYDICLYYKHGPAGLIMLGLVVDDTMIFCNGELEVNAFLKTLRERFPKVTDCKPKVFTGMELAQHKCWTEVGQVEYATQMLKNHKVIVDKRVMVPMTPAMFDRIRAEPRPEVAADRSNHFKSAGEVRWLDKTRYDLAFALGPISQFQNNSKPVDLAALGKLYQYIANTLHYKLRLGGKDKEIKAFLIVDGSKRDADSVLCQMMYLGRDAGAVEFKSKKNKCVALSSTEPEMRSILSAVKDAMWIRGLLKELGYEQDAPTPIYTDSDPCIDAIKSISHSTETRYLIPVIAFIRQEVSNHTVSIHKIKGTHNPADMGTKALTRNLLETYTKYALHGLGMRRYNGFDDFVKDDTYLE